MGERFTRINFLNSLAKKALQLFDEKKDLDFSEIKEFYNILMSFTSLLYKNDDIT